MVREILTIRTDTGKGNADPTFKDIALTDYSGKFPRMGFPELTATLMWPIPLDKEWNIGKDYVVLRGERFYIDDTPTTEKSNTPILWKHNIEFTSEYARVLGNTYFEDAVPTDKSDDSYDKPCTNSSTFKFYGTIEEVLSRLNCSFLKTRIGDSKLSQQTTLTTLDTVTGDGFCAMLDPYGAGSQYDPDKSYEFSWEDKTHWEAVTEIFNITEIPFERRGRKIIFGALPAVVEHKFEYGHDNELLSVSHKNAKAKVINRITMFGSSENIPHYYPNETEYGHIDIAVKPTNKALTANMVEIAHITTLLSRLNADTFAVLGKYSGGSGTISLNSYTYAFDDDLYSPYELGQYIRNNYTAKPLTSQWHTRVFFTVPSSGDIVCGGIFAKIWNQLDTPPSTTTDYATSVNVEMLKAQGAGETDYTAQVKTLGNMLDFGYLPAGDYFFQFSIEIETIDEATHNLINSICVLTNIGIQYNAQHKTGYYWQVGDKRYDSIGKLGVKLNATVTDAMIGDGFGWKASGRMPFQDHLVPPKYRDTLGAERYYNALNNSYIDPDTGDTYKFPNPYVAGAPCEHIYRNDEEKPTIEGVTNASGQLFGEIADIAYDADDNDALKPDTESDSKNDALKYEHSFFYIKLNIFNGDYGFDLFAHASQTDAMTIQMRDGSCNGCKFKIQAAKFTDEYGLETYKNPIIVNDGVAVGVVSEEGIKESDLDPTQQNTQTHSIWICVQKDAQTFGHIYPSQEQGIKPKVGDKFNIINIDLPQAYILAAEKRLEEKGIRYMSDNNEEKFTFDIQASRIFFAEHPEVLAQLDEYSKIKVRYDGKDYEQYVNQLTIDCKDNEVLPNIGIDLTDTLAVGQGFVENVAERAASLIANSATMGGALGGGGGLSTVLADMRYINKMKPDRTPYRLNVGDTFTAETGAHFGDFVQGQFNGHGGAVDGSGNAELESVTVRSYMKVMELIYNRLNAQEGDTTFSDFGTIDAVFTRADGRRVVQLRKRWEGDFTAFQTGDIIYGYVNNLDKANGKEWYKAWAWIASVDRANNQLVIAEYPGSEVPSGQNRPLTENMTVTRWGNIVEPSQQTFINPEYSAVIGKRSDGTYYNKRQQTFFISTENGNIVELMGVNKPILEDYNYGTILGRIPDGLLDEKTQELINQGQPYLYARGIIVQDLIRINYKGVPVRTANYRGQWNAQTAVSPTDYYDTTTTSYDTVTHNGALWQCIVPHSIDEPSELNPAWLKMTAGFNDGNELHLWVINPSTNIVSVRQNEVIPASLSATVTLNSTEGSPTTFTNNLDLYDAGAELWYSADGVTWERFTMGVSEPLDLEDESGVIELEDSVDDSHILTVGGDDIDTGTIGDRIYFELRAVEDNTVLAKTEVPVVKDGQDGKDGLAGRDGLMVYPAGNYDRNTLYSAESETTPVVLDGENYFRLKDGATYKGSQKSGDRDTPSKDVAKNDADTVWILFDKFDSIFANIIMAEFAKLGAAVFYGEWMISQKGVDSTGAASTAYQGFKTGNFTPNIAIDFENGEGTFRGNIRADGLTLGAQHPSEQSAGGSDWQLITGALVVAKNNGRYALPMLAAGCSRVIELLYVRFSQTAFNGFRLRGATESVYVGEGGDLFDNNKYATGGNDSEARDYLCDEPGLYRAVGFCIEFPDGNVTVWNVSRSADGAEARNKERIQDGTGSGPSGPGFTTIVGDAIKNLNP